MADRRLVTEDTTVGELLDLLADRGVTTVTLNLKHREDGTFGRVRLAAQPVIDTKSEERAESVIEYYIEYGRTAPAGHLPPTQAEDALDRAIRLLALHPDD